MARCNRTSLTGVVLGIAILASSVGCSSLHTKSPLGDLNEQVGAASQPVGEVIVELRSGTKREFLKAPLRETMFVQDALRGSGALDRFSRMDVVLVRPVDGGSKLRLDVTFDPSTHRVVDGENYALYPGDLVEVTQDKSTMLDRMIESALDNFGPITRNLPR